MKMIRTQVFLDENKIPQSVLVRRIETSDGRVERKFTLDVNGEWVVVPEGEIYPESAYLPVNSSAALVPCAGWCGKKFFVEPGNKVDTFCCDCWGKLA